MAALLVACAGAVPVAEPLPDMVPLPEGMVEVPFMVLLPAEGEAVVAEMEPLLTWGLGGEMEAPSNLEAVVRNASRVLPVSLLFNALAWGTFCVYVGGSIGRVENGKVRMKGKRCPSIHLEVCRGVKKSKNLRSINRHDHSLLTMHPLTAINPNRLRIIDRQKEALSSCLAHLHGHEPAEDGVFLGCAWSLEGRGDDGVVCREEGEFDNVALFGFDVVGGEFEAALADVDDEVFGEDGGGGEEEGGEGEEGGSSREHYEVVYV